MTAENYDRAAARHPTRLRLDKEQARPEPIGYRVIHQGQLVTLDPSDVEQIMTWQDREPIRYLCQIDGRWIVKRPEDVVIVTDND